MNPNPHSVSLCLCGEFSFPLTTRNDPNEQRRDIVDRLVQVRAATLDESNRSVEVILATENPVTVFDWERGIIDEVLMADGGMYPQGGGQMPLLANHSRSSLEDVLGSVRGFRRDGASWVGRAYLATGSEAADRAWNLVKQGHLTDVSIGYRSTEFVDIPAGQTATVAGRSFTANSQRALRITTRYEPKELSLVPIGADRAAKVRNIAGDPGKEPPMNPQLRTYLESLGLRADASVDEAKAFHAALGGVYKTRADKVAAGTLTAEAASAEGTVRTEPTQPATPATPATPQGGQTPEQIRAEALRVERERVTQIRALAGNDVDPELLARAESEGWTVEQASREFLKSIRGQRSAGVSIEGTQQAPAGIVRNHERDCSVQALQFAMVQRSGINVEAWAKRQNIANWTNLATASDRFRYFSMIEVVREAIRLDGKRLPHSPEDQIREAVSGGTLSNIFTTSAYANLMQAWIEEVDSTDGWVAEQDLANFLTHTDIDTSSDASLKKLARGKTAQHSTMKDNGVTYKIARYGKQFSVDEQDIIDDRFDVLIDAPRAHGQRARQLRPNLVYALLLANPTVTSITGKANADGTPGSGALFNSTALTTAGGHANLGSDVLASAGLKTGITAMGKQYRLEGQSTKIPLNITPRFLIVPPDLRFTAAELLQSAAVVIAGTAGTVTERGTANVLQNILELRVDQRISATGVVDPSTDTAYTGSATNWFLASQPNGRTIKVLYRQGTNRSPVLRSFQLMQGQWGLGWDINMDIAAAVLDYPGLYKGNA